jgi:hypothetical protein
VGRRGSGRRQARVRERRPLGVGTGSLAILSSLSEEEIKHVVSSNGPRLPEYGLTPTSLLAQVKRAQKLGYAVREMPTLAGVKSVKEKDQSLGFAPQQDDGTLDVPASKVVALGAGVGDVDDGAW